MTLKSQIAVSDLVNLMNEGIPELMKEFNIPGISIALIRNAERVWTHGFGVLNTKTCRPVTPGTVFEGCSLSKPVFAYAVMGLCESGVLSLDTSLARFLDYPYVPDDPRLQKITMRHALTHTAGFPNWRPDCWDTHGWNPERNPLEINLEPGERFSYSGEGYMYVQQVLEHVTGRSGEEFMHSQLFEPAGMRNSTYICTSDNRPELASGHDQHARPATKQMYKHMCSAASLHATAADVAQVLCATMRPNSAIPWHRSADVTREMITDHVPVNDSASWHDDWPDVPVSDNPYISWGLGWATQKYKGTKSFWHWGDNGTFKAFAIGYAKEGIGLVAMANGSNAYKLWRPLCELSLGGEYPCIDWLDRVVYNRPL